MTDPGELRIEVWVKCEHCKGTGSEPYEQQGSTAMVTQESRPACTRCGAHAHPGYSPVPRLLTLTDLAAALGAAAVAAVK